MNQILKPKNDIVFKTLFSKNGNETFLIDFLSSLLGIEIKTINILKEVELQYLSAIEKAGRLDLKVIINDSLVVSIEMQLKNNYNIEKRTIFYGSKIIAEDLVKGEEYKYLKPVIVICILDFELPNTKEYVCKSVTVDEKHKKCELIKDLKYIFIELPKFRKTKPDLTKKVNQWLSFIDYEKKEDIEMAKQSNVLIKNAIDEYEYLTGDEALRRRVELYESGLREIASAKSCGYLEGEQSGIIKGEKRGIIKGEQRGIIKGEKNGIIKGALKEKLEIAKRLKKQGYSLNDIVLITNLDKREIESLK